MENFKAGDTVICIQELPKEVAENTDSKNLELDKSFTVEKVVMKFGKQHLVLKGHHPFNYHKGYRHYVGHIIGSAHSASASRFTKER